MVREGEVQELLLTKTSLEGGVQQPAHSCGSTAPSPTPDMPPVAHRW